MLYQAVLATARKAASRPQALNAKDTEALMANEPDPKIIGMLLLKMRKRDTLRPVDLTELRVAVKENPWNRAAFGNDFDQAIAETWMENEVKKDTPRKPD